MDVSIIVVNFNTEKLLLDCLESVYKTVKNISFEVWLVDNASYDNSVTSAKEIYPDINIIQNKKNLGFGAANNLAFKKMKGKYALLLNTDAVLKENALKILFEFMEQNKKAGMAGGQLLNTDGSKQNSTAKFPTFLSLISNESILKRVIRQDNNTPIEVDSCIGACLMIRKEALNQAGFFDERYFFFFEETDLAKTMHELGWKIFFVPNAHIVHAQGQSVGSGADARIMFYRSRYIFFKKWYPDSFYLIKAAVFFRLLINTFFSSLGAVLSLFLNKSLNKRVYRYLDLILWHLKGCK